MSSYTFTDSDLQFLQQLLSLDSDLSQDSVAQVPCATVENSPDPYAPMEFNTATDNPLGNYQYVQLGVNNPFNLAVSTYIKKSDNQ